MKSMLLIREEIGNAWQKTMEKAEPISGFTLRFLGTDAGQTIHKVDIRNINFQDLMRHLRCGESVIITPKPNGHTLDNVRKQENRAPWYFTHI